MYVCLVKFDRRTLRGGGVGAQLSQLTVTMDGKKILTLFDACFQFNLVLNEEIENIQKRETRLSFYWRNTYASMTKNLLKILLLNVLITVLVHIF